jgi:hypothetical protein
MAREDFQLQSAAAWDELANPFVADADGALGAAEWSVIDMARAEGPRSADPNAFFNRLLSKLFGIARARPLANKRLESLRRFAVAAWFRAELRVRDMRALFDAGFTSNDAARIIAYVGLHRGIVPEVEAWP